MTTVTPFPVGLSDGLIEALADELETAGSGQHAPVLRRLLPKYVVRWLAAGVPRAAVDAEAARICEAAAVTVVMRKAQRMAEENARAGGVPS